MRIAAGLSTILLAGSVWAAGPAYMVKDLKPTPQSLYHEWGMTAEFVAFEGYVYFQATDGVHGVELWRWSAGTGMELFADICPGVCWSHPWELTEWRGHLYFVATGPGGGRELWRTDGTPEGTFAAVDLAPGLESSSPMWLTATPDALYFVAEVPADDRELWKSDGTLEGTVRVADIRPGAEGSEPQTLVERDGVVYFGADDGVHGRELWRSDGSPLGTHLLSDLCPGPQSCVEPESSFYYGARSIAATDGRVLARLGNGASGLAVVDPVDGSFEIFEPSPRGIHRPFLEAGGVVFFGAYQWPDPPGQLWRFDDATGLELLGVFDEPPRLLGALDGLVYLQVLDGGQHRLWSTDGTVAGTQEVVVLGPPAGGIENITASPGVLLGDEMLFTVGIDGFGTELWRTDGTSAGTALVDDLYPGPIGAFSDLWLPTMLVPFGEGIVFRAFGIDQGWEIWRSDGTAAGTTLIADLLAPEDGIVKSSFVAPFLNAAVAGDHLLFGGDDGVSGAELWRTDGSDAGTELVADLIPGGPEGFPDGSYARPWATLGGKALVISQLGVSAATGEIGEVELLTEDNGWGRFETLRGLGGGAPTRAFFGGLFESDGSAAGTSMIADDVLHDSLAAAGDRLFVSKYDSAGTELWVVEGDPGVIMPVADIHPGADSSSPAPVGHLGERYLFSADDGSSGRELWVSSGTAGDTYRVRDIHPGPDSSAPSGYEFGRKAARTRAGVFFAADDGSSGRELWLSDGSEAGTRRVADLRPGPLPSDPTDLVVAGRRLFLLANDGVHGRELWVARATGEAPRMVRDIAAGSASSTPARRIGVELEAVGSRVYFGATDGTNGVELWTSDGTRQGTWRVQDIHPGPGSSSPEGFFLAHGCLYFSANDGEHGFELWALPVDPLSGAIRPGTCEPQPTKRSPATRSRRP